MPSSNPCANCLYWDPIADSAYGRCRVNAPTVVNTLQAAPDQGSAHWPLTAATDWCGEWAAGTMEAHIGLA